MEALKNKYAQQLIDSVEFLKQLCELAKDIRQMEKYGEPEKPKEDGKKVLTRLFEQVKSTKTSIMVKKVSEVK